MAPPHVASFKKFEARIPNRLEASIAFGLFMESEKQWAEREGSPSEAKYRNYQEALLTDYEIDRYARQAREFLADFGNEAVAKKRPELLQASLIAYEAAAREGHSRFRGFGILEALIGALVWTVALILFSFVLKYSGIDVIEVLHKVVGH
jgi:hypothetical protein